MLPLWIIITQAGALSTKIKRELLNLYPSSLRLSQTDFGTSLQNYYQWDAHRDGQCLTLKFAYFLHSLNDNLTNNSRVIYPKDITENQIKYKK